MGDESFTLTMWDVKIFVFVSPTPHQAVLP